MALDIEYKLVAAHLRVGQLLVKRCVRVNVIEPTLPPGRSIGHVKSQQRARCATTGNKKTATVQTFSLRVSGGELVRQPIALKINFRQRHRCVLAIGRSINLDRQTLAVWIFLWRSGFTHFVPPVGDRELSDPESTK